MRTMQAQAGLLSAMLVAAGLAAASTGCKMFSKDEESTAPETAAAAPEPEPEATATVDAEESNSTGNVKTYPNQIAASGMYRVLRDFSIYEEADTTSKRLGGVGRGTLIYLKATLGQWLLIEWPSAVGTMSPGWVQVKVTSNRPDPTFAEEVKEPPDAGTVATAVVDAGTKPPPTDAGPGGMRRPVFKFPKPKK